MLSANEDTLRQMVAKIEPTVPEPARRAFLERSAAALFALVGGMTLVATGCPKGHRPDRPEESEAKRKARQAKQAKAVEAAKKADEAASGGSAQPSKKTTPSKK